MYQALLREWCDGLIAYQLEGFHDPRLNGGMMCPACRIMHGRCPDAVYPMLYMADKTGEGKYLHSARALFAWQENMLCDDGSVYNDGNSPWNGITVFAATALCEALAHHGHLLESGERVKWEARLSKMGEWLYANIDEHTATNINYVATNAAALSLLGNYLANDAYLARARRLAEFVMNHFTSDGLLWGEGSPRDDITKRGCRPVDMGYNVEESIPSLVKYAIAQSDASTLAALKSILHKQLAFMLPDGGWDNSFGTRNNKWTYWGSRTSDGCAGAYGLLSDDPIFAEATRRNLLLMKNCTHGGLLHGGPEYQQHGEPPCIHHTFTHANALTAALDAGIRMPPTDTPLPCDHPPEKTQYFREIDTWKLAVGGMRATVTACDHSIAAGHATGGTLTLLWHQKTGPLIVSSMVDYFLAEPLNMQLPLKKERHRTLTPRLERIIEGKRFAQCYDTDAVIHVDSEGDQISVTVEASLVSLKQERPARETRCTLKYEIYDERENISGVIRGEMEGTVFVLPVIAPEARVSATPECADDPREIFFLCGGFGAREHVIRPDAEGRFRVAVEVC